MAKIITIDDNTPLYNGKLFLVKMEGEPSVHITKILRIENGVPDDERNLFAPNGSLQIPWDAFAEGEEVLVRYMETDEDAYHIVNLRAWNAREAGRTSVGNVKAGYISENQNDFIGNTVDYAIPGGLTVGYGGDGSSERVLVKNEFNVDNKAGFGQIGNHFYLGAPLEDVNRSLFFGFGTLLQEKLIGSFDEEYTITPNDVTFDGDTTITTTLNGEEGTIIVHIIDNDNGDAVIGKFQAEVLDNNTVLIKNTNLPAVMENTNYTMGVVVLPVNSVAIGNQTSFPASNEIVIGAEDGSQTIRLKGNVVTDSPLTGSANLTDITITDSFEFTGAGGTGTAEFSGGDLHISNDTVYVTGTGWYQESGTFSLDIMPEFIGGAKTFGLLDVRGNMRTQGSCFFDGQAVFNDPVTMENDLLCNWSLTVDGSSFTSNASTNSFLETVGFTKDVDVTRDVNVNGDLFVNGGTSLDFVTAETLNVNSLIVDVSVDFNTTGFVVFGAHTQRFDTQTYFYHNTTFAAPIGGDPSYNGVTFGDGFTVQAGTVSFPNGDTSIDKLTLTGDFSSPWGTYVTAAQNFTFNSSLLFVDMDASLSVNNSMAANAVKTEEFSMKNGSPTLPTQPAIPNAATPADLTEVKNKLNNVLQILRDFGFIET